MQIIHAWGNSTTDGIYYNICKDYGIEYLDFKASNNYKYRIGEKDLQSFEAVCRKVLDEIPSKSYKPKYDLILVDEAQDLSESFLQLCHNILTADKRLIYAYDELQKLYEGSSLKNPKEIFGIDDFDDRMLKVCYRNSKPVLTTAHSLGFGIYRDKPEGQRLVQFFDNPKLWEDVGYEVKEGNMVAGETVKLARTKLSSPPYLEKNLSIVNDDLIQFHSFNNKEDQAKFIAQSIKNDIVDEELLTKDIIVINPEALTTKSEVGIVRLALQKLGYNTHIAGVTDADVFFQNNSITFTGINRAKGNEVPMVYIMNSDYCFQGSELKKKRNILFTAITRSKAWVRVCGIGSNMDGLVNEFKKVKENRFTLKFIYPTDEQIKKMNLINRDMSEDEKEEIKTVANSIKDIQKFVDRIKKGKASIDDFPEDVQPILEQLLK